MADKQEKSIEERLQEAYDLIIRPIALPFYNDLFMTYIIGRNIETKLTIPTNLKLKVVRKKIHTTILYTKDYLELNNNALIEIQLDYRIHNFFSRIYGDKLNIYYDKRYYLYNYDLIKKFPKNSKLVYILFTHIPNSSKTNDLIEVVSNICNNFNIDVDFEIIEIKISDNYKISEKTINTENVIIRFVGRIDGIENTPVYYKIQKNITKLANKIKCKNMIISGLLQNYVPKLTWDIVQNISLDFKKCYLFWAKYNFLHRRFSIILYDRKKNNNYVIKKRDIYRLYNNDYSNEYKKFMSDIIDIKNNRSYIFIEYYRMKENEPHYAKMIMNKINIHKQYITLSKD